MSLFTVIKNPFQFPYPVEDPDPSKRRIFINNVAYDLDTLQPYRERFSFQGNVFANTATANLRSHDVGIQNTASYQLYDTGGYPITQGKRGSCFANSLTAGTDYGIFAQPGYVDSWLTSLDYDKNILNGFYDADLDRSYLLFPGWQNTASDRTIQSYATKDLVSPTPTGFNKSNVYAISGVITKQRTEAGDYLTVEHELSTTYAGKSNFDSGGISTTYIPQRRRTVTSGLAFYVCDTEAGGHIFIEHFPSNNSLSYYYHPNSEAIGPELILSMATIQSSAGGGALFPSNNKKSSDPNRVVHYVLRNDTTTATHFSRVVVDRKNATMYWNTCTVNETAYPYKNNYLFSAGTSSVTGSVLGVNTTTVINYGTQTDFTIEAFIQIDFPIPYSTTAGIAENDSTNETNWYTIIGSNDGNVDNGVSFQVSRNKLILNYESYGFTSQLNHGIVPGPWYHVAVARRNQNLTFFVNGRSLGGAFHPQAKTTGNSIFIGARSNGSSWFKGRISNLRVVLGTAVYIGNFTVPATPLTTTQTASTNVQAISTGTFTTLLACTSSTAVDQSITARTFVNTATTILVTAKSHQHPPHPASVATFNNQMPFFRKGHVFNHNGIDYISVMIVDKAIDTGFMGNSTSEYGLSSRWYVAASRTVPTYSIGAGNNDNQLTWHSEYVFNWCDDVPTGFCPLNSAGDTLLITQLGRVSTFRFNALQGWTATNVTSIDARSYALDSTGRVWITTKGFAARTQTGDSDYIGNGYAEVHLYNPYTERVGEVSLVPSIPNLEYTGTTSSFSISLAVDDKKLFREYRTNSALVFESNPSNPFGLTTTNVASIYIPLSAGTRIFESRNHNDFNFRTLDFTIEFWLRSEVAWASQSANAGLFSQRGLDDTSWGWSIQKGTTGLLFRVGRSTYYDLDSGVAPTTNAWEHYVVQRKDHVLQWYRNGSLIASRDFVVDIHEHTYPFLVNYNLQGAAYFQRIYLHGLRICKGVALYNLPTYPYPPSQPVEAVQTATVVSNVEYVKAVTDQCVLLTFRNSKRTGRDYSIFDDYSSFEQRDVILKAIGSSIRFGVIGDNSSTYTTSTSRSGPISIPAVVVATGSSVIRVLNASEYISTLANPITLSGYIVGETASINLAQFTATSYALVGSLPTGLSFNTATAVISGVVDVVASNTNYSFSVNVTTDRGTAQQAYILPIYITATISVEVFMVGGGGGGGGVQIGSGGGGGGVLEGTMDVPVVPRAIPIIIGAGGRGGLMNQLPATGQPGAAGGEGGNTEFLGYTAIGGGGGVSWSNSPVTNSGRSGGSGSGGGSQRPNVQPGGASVQTSLLSMTAYGNAGGQGTANPGSSSLSPGGGGGAGGAGGAGISAPGSPTKAGDGGIGRVNTWQDTTSRTFGGGGSGYPFSTAANPAQTAGGGGYAVSPFATQNGQAGTGGGGAGGGWPSSPPSGNGGSGYFVLRYTGAVPKFIGGVINQYVQNSQNYVSHMFTSSDVLLYTDQYQ